MPVKSTAIIGAGVAGLTLALSLAQKGIASEIFEQADELREVGAGLQLSPNATRVLRELGLLNRLRSLWTEPESIDLRSGETLKTYVSLPVGKVAEDRWSAPYGVVHRATLQRVLLEAVRANSLCRLHLGLRLDLKQADDIRPYCDHRPDLVVGADGVWSRTRNLVPGAPQSVFTGNVAWRLVVPFSEVPPVLPRNRVTAYMAPGAHLICYPLKDGGGFNMVAITSGVDPGETWGTNGEPKRVSALRSKFSKWHPSLQALLSRHDELLYWPLCQATDGNWHNGSNVVLIGDAAHAMMPFMAQGAASAIEDAHALAQQLAEKPPEAALSSFESLRKPRAERLRARAAFNCRVYHASGLFRLGRDIAMAIRPQSSYLADLDWIYGYSA